MTEETFTQYMDLMSATWPDRSPSEETVAAYWLALNHLEDDEFSAAVMRCLQECTFYPRPAEILQWTSVSRPGALQPAWLNDPVQVRRMEQLQEQGYIVQRLRRRKRQEIEHGDRERLELTAGS